MARRISFLYTPIERAPGRGHTLGMAKHPKRPGECVGTERRRVEGRPDPGARQHVVYRTQPNDANGQLSLHSPDQCVQQEGREPRSHGRAAQDVLQFRPYPSDDYVQPRDRGRRHSEVVGSCRRGESVGNLGSAAGDDRSLRRRNRGEGAFSVMKKRSRLTQKPKPKKEQRTATQSQAQPPKRSHVAVRVWQVALTALTVGSLPITYLALWPTVSLSFHDSRDLKVTVHRAFFRSEF